MPKKLDIQDEILTVQSVSEMLSVSPNAVRKKLRDKSIKGVKRFGRWFVLKSELLRYFNNSPHNEST